MSGGVHERLRLDKPALIKFLYLLLTSGHTLPLPTQSDKPSAAGSKWMEGFFLGGGRLIEGEFQHRSIPER